MKCKFIIVLMIIFIIGALLSAFYICLSRKEKPELTVDIVSELSKKGNHLHWSDFEQYKSRKIDSSQLYILQYDVKDEELMIEIGGIPDKMPWYIWLISTKYVDSYIDVSFDNVKEYVDLIHRGVYLRSSVEPLYNHFPDLPENAEARWCSEESSGIGLTTLKVHMYLFYKRDISEDFIVGDIVELKPYLELERAKNQRWRKVEDLPISAFQSGIDDENKLNTTVYINEDGNMLYIDAIGE